MSVLLNNRYRIIQTLGKGGFGATFIAEDTHLPSNRKCVIKQLIFSCNDPALHQLIRERFQREAAILERLGESNDQIPKLYAYFNEKDQFYLVQEFIEGQTLATKLKTEGRIDEHAATKLLASLLLVLEYIHSSKIIHRDIKPENIILRKQDGKPILIDFGAIKESARTLVGSNMVTSIMIGTPGYIPVEQMAGKPVFSSDLYSLSTTIIVMLTGKSPQELTDPSNGNILWQAHRPNISRTFSTILNKSVQTDYRNRYSTARETLNALQETKEKPPSRNLPPYYIPLSFLSFTLPTVLIFLTCYPFQTHIDLTTNYFLSIVVGSISFALTQSQFSLNPPPRKFPRLYIPLSLLSFILPATLTFLICYSRYYDTYMDLIKSSFLSIIVGSISFALGCFYILPFLRIFAKFSKLLRIE
jgi:serine/threonine protein kinase